MDRFYSDENDLLFLKTPAAAASLPSRAPRLTPGKARPTTAGGVPPVRESEAQLRQLLARERERNGQLEKRVAALESALRNAYQLTAWGGGRRVTVGARDEH